MKLNELKLEEVRELCENNKVKSLFAFGSITRNDFNAESDVDLIVDFYENDPFNYTDLYFSLKSNLEILLKRPIDLLEARAIKNKLFKQELDNTKFKIYGA